MLVEEMFTEYCSTDGKRLFEKFDEIRFPHGGTSTRMFALVHSAACLVVTSTS